MNDSASPVSGRNGKRELLLAKYWAQAEEPPIALPVADSKVFRQHRAENIRLFAYGTYVAEQFSKFQNVPFALALFDGEGYLLRLFGQQEVLHNLAIDGIIEKTMWNVKLLGTNAVSVGLAEHRQMTTTGEENDALPLRQYALYFSPISLQNDYPPFSLIEYGGIAIITTVKNHNPEYALFAFEIAENIMVNIHFQIRTISLHEQKGRGLLFLDISGDAGKVTVNHHNGKVFEILGVPPMDIGYWPVEKLIDPLPKNREFWSIIKKRRCLRDYDLTLSIRGKEVRCIVTTDIHNQPSLNVLSIIFSITTAKLISSEVAQKMGNNAVRTFRDIIGASPKLQATIERAKILAQTDSNVMLLGESGVGKDIFAQAIHNTGMRREKPFISVNCGALPRDLIASELFGYSSGAFTGAKRNGNIGKFELANGGTIFLDEIGELPLDLQATLLRVVEQKEFMPLGSNKTVSLDVRILTATNANVLEMIEQKQFRADLYYRLSTIHLEIPPLRERGEDVILLANYFIQNISARINRPSEMTLSPEAEQLLLTLPWNGNIRELQNLIENIVQIYPGPVIRPEHIQENIKLSTISHPSHYVQLPAYPKRSKKTLLTAEDILGALRACNGNRSEAARYLGIARKTLYRNMERLGISPE